MNEEQLRKLVKEKIIGYRKGCKELAYLHSWRVADFLKEMNYQSDIVEAGLLHDIVEDGEMSIKVLRELGMNERVLDLVNLCSFKEEIENGDARWVEMIGRIIQAQDNDALTIKVVDTIDNLSSCHTMVAIRRQFLRLVKGPLLYSLTEGKIDKKLREKFREILDLGLEKEQVKDRIEI